MILVYKYFLTNIYQNSPAYLNCNKMTSVLFQNYPIIENNEPLVDLSKFDFLLEPSYFKQGFSNDRRMFLREGVAKKLEEIQKELKIYRIKIWDGFRSRAVQNTIYQKFWDELQKLHPDWNNEKLKTEVGTFITEANNENKIPPHATGGAVDLTLTNLDGKDLNFGTTFDYFGLEAHSDYFDTNKIKSTERKNRILLREAMFSKNFIEYSDEWWHFDYGNQLWAIEKHKPFAIYGEASTPKLN